MHDLKNSKQSLWRVLVRSIALVAGVCALAASSAAAQADRDAPGALTPVEVSSVPASRQADRIVVITVDGAIDRMTAISVKRRLEAAERAGFDGFVLEVNSPGGDLGACLEISQAIKSSSITNSVAWVNDEAYSGGAIISLACDEIVTSDPSSFGDALIILVDMLGMTGMQTLSPEQRTKALPPLMADVIDSARRSGYDEFLVQAIVTDGIELWQVEDMDTGERLAISENEYRMLFDGDPIRGRPMLAHVTGGVKTYQDPAREPNGEERPDAGVADEDQDAAAAGPDGEEAARGDAGGDQEAPATDQGQEEPGMTDPNAYRPASDTLRDVEEEFEKTERSAELTLMQETNRRLITPADKGRYRLVGYICDGSSAIVMREQEMIEFGLSTKIVKNDEELKAFFNAKSLTRVNENVFEKLVRFLTNPFVQFVIIAIFLLAILVEMVTAGTGIAGAVALTALLLLVGPGALLGLSGWWEVIAIVAGLICLAIEIFVVPGFGVFGVVGFIALFGGLLGTLVNSGGSMSSPQMQQQLLRGSVTVLLAFVTAGVLWWLFIRRAQDLPIFQRLMLNDIPASPSGSTRTLLHAITMDDGTVREGDIGLTTTPLYPIGQAEFNGDLHDVYSAFGTIEANVAVRAVRVTRMRIEVEAVNEQIASGNTDIEHDDGDDESRGGEA